jgi:hypothetical protein
MARIALTTATPNNDPVTYAVTSGTLPTGMTLNASTGVISGTPGSSGYNVNGVTSTVTVTATNTVTGNATAKSINIVRRWYDGTSATYAVPTNQTVSSITTATGQTSGDIYVKDNLGRAIYTKVYVNSGTAYVLMGGISDDLSHGQFTGGSGSNSSGQGVWHKKWTTDECFGSRTVPNGPLGYKNELWSDYTYNDFLIMQGFTASDISADFYTNSTEVAYTNANVLSNKGSNLRSFLSGDESNTPNIARNGTAGRQQFDVTFLKGTSVASRARYRGNSFGELNPNNKIDFGIQNVEGYRFAVINALGCQSTGSANNVEHHSWVSDINNNYSNRNFPEPNWDGSWGITVAGNWMYWLWWAKS